MDYVPHRLEKREMGNKIILDNSYNSNPASFLCSLEVLAMFENRRKIVVTPGVVEQGKGAYDENYREQPAMLKVAGSLDMTAGRIEAIYTTVGFAGSITPRLVVYDRIEDSRNSDYYWDVASSAANFADVTLAELNRLATYAAHFERVAGTDSSQLFGGVVANKNATAADFMNAIREIQARVRAKYRLLNL